MAKAKKFACKKCDASFDRVQSLGTHMWARHGVQGKHHKRNEKHARRAIGRPRGSKNSKRKFAVDSRVTFCPRCGTNIHNIEGAIAFGERH